MSALVLGMLCSHTGRHATTVRQFACISPFFAKAQSLRNLSIETWTLTFGRSSV